MTFPVIAAAQALQGATSTQGVASAAASIGGAGGAQGASFGELVRNGLAGVEQELQTSQADLQQLAVGNVENLHEIMIRMEESRLSFQLLLQVRNRLLEAYQDVMRTQV